MGEKGRAEMVMGDPGVLPDLRTDVLLQSASHLSSWSWRWSSNACRKSTHKAVIYTEKLDTSQSTQCYSDQRTSAFDGRGLWNRGLAQAMAISTISRFFACGNIRATCSSRNRSVRSFVLSRVSARNNSATFRLSREDSHPEWSNEYTPRRISFGGH